MTRHLSLQVLENRTNPSLSYVSYFGGDNSDEITSVGFDAAGDIYVAGRTESSAIPLGTSPNNTFGEAFVAKLDPTGSTLIWRTYLASQPITGMAVDAAGDAYVTGTVEASGFATVGAAQIGYGGNVDAFAAKLNPSGSIVYATYIGGNQLDQANGIAIDSAGDAFVTGYTLSPNFPNQNALQGSLHVNSGEDAFITKINPTGTQFLFSTYLGGNANGPGENGATFSIGKAIAVDKAGNPYVTGYTEAADFITVNPFKATKGGGNDVFITELKSDGSQALYSTFLSGNGQPIDPGDDLGNAIAVDGSGDIIVAGQTTSLAFPLKNAFEKLQGDGDTGLSDGFVTKLDPTKTGTGQLVYSTYLGGNADDEALSIGLDAKGDAFVGGDTLSKLKFPLVHPFPKMEHGNGFLAEFSPAGRGLLCSFFGYDGEKVEAVAASPLGPIVFVGNTQSNLVPTTSNAFQPKFPDATDSGFIAMLGGIGKPKPPSGTDADGDTWTVTLHGPGTAVVTTDANGAIASIVLQGTTSRSSLSISVRKAKTGDGYVDVGSITGPGIGTIRAAKANLTGTGINLTGALGRLTIHDISNGADVIAAGLATDSTSITAHQIGAGTAINPGGSLSLLKAASVGTATIQAVELKRLDVVGDRRASIAGDFAATVTLSNTAVAIASARIAGTFTGTITANAGEVESFEANSLVAGNLTANEIGRIKFATVQTNDGGIKFGIRAHTSIKSVAVKSPAFAYDPTKLTPQGIGDFEVVIS